jgi:3D (Asp-Asp-Asp) domain-containing protein
MMPLTIISGSLVRKLAATCIAVIGFVLLYEVSVFDLRQSNPVKVVDPTAPAAGARLEFTATAYCKGTTTASGVEVRTGIAASDPSILPVGSVVNISTHDVKYNGVYTIMDTGPAVQGRTLDLYMWSCHEALRFGRRPVELSVLRLGWNPAASTPSFVDRLFRRREAARVQPQAPQPAPTDAQHEDATQQAPVHTDQAVGSAGESATPAVPATPLLNTP